MNMKPILAAIGIVLLTTPVLRFLRLDRSLADPANGDPAAFIVSIPAGFMQGFVGLMILGVLCDGGAGYKPLWLLSTMALIGIFWTAAYPSGWLLGIPLILYSAEKLLRMKSRSRSKAKEAD